MSCLPEMDKLEFRDFDRLAAQERRDASGSASSDHEAALRRIRRALLSDGDLLQLQLGTDERARGVNPYNSSLGGKSRDVWRAGGRRRV